MGGSSGEEGCSRGRGCSNGGAAIEGRKRFSMATSSLQDKRWVLPVHCGSTADSTATAAVLTSALWQQQSYSAVSTPPCANLVVVGCFAVGLLCHSGCSACLFRCDADEWLLTEEGQSSSSVQH